MHSFNRVYALDVTQYVSEHLEGCSIACAFIVWPRSVENSFHTLVFHAMAQLTFSTRHFSYIMLLVFHLENSIYFSTSLLESPVPLQLDIKAADACGMLDVSGNLVDSCVHTNLRVLRTICQSMSFHRRVCSQTSIADTYDIATESPAVMTVQYAECIIYRIWSIVWSVHAHHRVFHCWRGRRGVLLTCRHPWWQTWARWCCQTRLLSRSVSLDKMS